MLALRRLRITPVSFLRGNTTVATTSVTVDDAPPPPITPKTDSRSTPSSDKDAEPKVLTTQGRRKRERIIKKRPNISLGNPREWKRPIAYGVLPAYDEALRYLIKDSATLKKEAEGLKVAIQQEEAASEKDEDALEKKRKKLHILEVQSEINLPEVRWKVANGMGE
jgi:hypothetical protein